MHGARPFDLFGSDHLIILCLTSLGGFLFVAISASRIARTRRRKIELSFAALIAVQFLLERVWYLRFGGYTFVELLPLHLCNTSTILACVLLLTQSRMVFQVLYYWGWAGATMGMLMPEVEYPWPHPLFLSYFFGHAYIVYGVAYMIIVRGYRPTAGSLKKVFLITNCYMVIVAGINLLLGTNYLFLCQKPAGSGLMDYLGPWPFYIVGLEIIGAVLMLIVFSPWGIAEVIRQKRARIESAAGLTGVHEQPDLVN